jgi:hypothetical protein
MDTPDVNVCFGSIAVPAVLRYHLLKNNASRLHGGVSAEYSSDLLPKIYC